MTRTDAEKVAAIRELHSPVPIPEGKKWMAHEEGETPCAGCQTGDPFLDEPWPCETRRICDDSDE